MVISPNRIKAVRIKLDLIKLNLIEDDNVSAIILASRSNRR